MCFIDLFVQILIFTIQSHVSHQASESPTFIFDKNTVLWQIIEQNVYHFDHSFVRMMAFKVFSTYPLLVICTLVMA
jgi:hypothetical protein